MQIAQINARNQQDIASAAAAAAAAAALSTERDNLLLLVQRLRHEHEVLGQQFADKSLLSEELSNELRKVQAGARDDVLLLQRSLDDVQREVRGVVRNTEIRFVVV